VRRIAPEARTFTVSDAATLASALEGLGADVPAGVRA